MAITLDTLTLPADLAWPDEWSWSPVAQSAEYGVEGALVVESSAKLAGREITLESPPDQAVVTRATLDTLRSWAAAAGKEMTLTLRGTPRTVLFDHARVALEATPLQSWCDPPADALYTVKLRFIQV
jgi:hypothetical protein